VKQEHEKVKARKEKKKKKKHVTKRKRNWIFIVISWIDNDSDDYDNNHVNRLMINELSPLSNGNNASIDQFLNFVCNSRIS
jgi:hypothetical protein